jgi:hypothetical protein
MQDALPESATDSAPKNLFIVYIPGLGGNHWWHDPGTRDKSKRTNKKVIHIFFVPGMFGSLIEYVLRDFTKELSPTNAEIANDGSMHTFKKQNHPNSKLVLNTTDLGEVNTPIYPFNDLHLPDILKLYPINADDRCILIYAKSFKEAEQNILFQYHKISCGLELGLKIFYGSPADAKVNVSRWNQNYTEYSNLAPWEFREWFSIFYPSWIQEWQDSCEQVPASWLKISPDDILFNTKDTFENVIEFCKLTKKCELETFVDQWQHAQKYILDEYVLLNNIVDATIKQQAYTWKPLHLIAEAIIQKKLRDNGHEIRCDGLNTFPTSSIELYKLLDNQL